MFILNNILKTVLILFAVSLAVLFAPVAFAQSQVAEEQFEPYWEFGMGMGYVQYENYPASNQFSHLMMAFPTFQYRGKILRANDREGAHVYILKGETWNFQLSGTFYPAYDSSKDETRRGMDNLPWMTALGPQFVYSFSDDLKMGFGIFQAVIANLPYTRLSGEIFEAMMTYQWFADHSFGKISLKIRGGTQEFLSTYFQVNPNEVTPTRTAYEAHDGLLSQQISYYQSYKTGRIAIYAGGSIENYAQSVNRGSPLHKSDLDFTYAAGITYLIGESSKPGVHEHDTSGVINKLNSK